MGKKKISVKTEKVKEMLKKGGRKNARRDFFELLRRAARTEKGEVEKLATKNV